jgi:hypothetical protein
MGCSSTGTVHPQAEDHRGLQKTFATPANKKARRSCRRAFEIAFCLRLYQQHTTSTVTFGAEMGEPVAAAPGGLIQSPNPSVAPPAAPSLESDVLDTAPNSREPEPSGVEKCRRPEAGVVTGGLLLAVGTPPTQTHVIDQVSVMICGALPG